MNTQALLTMLTSATGDSGKPFLIAICMTVSIILIVALFVTSRYSDKKDQEDEDEEV